MLTYLLIKGILLLKENLIQKWTPKTATINLREKHIYLNELQQNY